MQDRYVGDVGDFVKFGLLRALAQRSRLGIIWYRVPSADLGGDGRHISYLNDVLWEALDQDLFGKLRTIVRKNERYIQALEEASIIGDCRFFSDMVPMPLRFSERPEARQRWLEKALEAVSSCDIVFLDPDNGLQPQRYSSTRKQSAKSVSFNDLACLKRSGRTLIVYHHQTRRVGGHIAEIDYNARRLREKGFSRVDAIRFSRYSPRVFFILNASDAIRERARRFVNRWGPDRASWHRDPAET
jgi:hypothetical protein